MTPSSVLDAPLVPLGRFGALLVTRRRALELSIDEMARRSNGRFTPALLSEIERARVVLDDPTMAAIAELYGVDKGSVIPERSRLVLDFDADTIRVGERSLPLGRGQVRPAHQLNPDERLDVILERYLSLLYLMRNLPVGSRVSLREPDLLVLSSTLQCEMTSIESRLVGLMDAAGITPRTQSLLKRFLLPSAGLFVAASSVGSLVIVNGAADHGTVTTPSLTDRITVSQTFDQTAPSANSLHANGAVHADDDRRRIVPDRAAHTREHTSALDDAGSSHDEPTRSAAVARSARTAEERQAVGADAEALISYDWRSKLPGWSVAYAGDDVAYKGMTTVPDKTITIYLDEVVTIEGVAGVLAHEIGHALDVTHLDNETRRRWIESRDIAPVWWAGSGLNDFSVGSGDFAEAVARHLVDSPSDSAHGEFTESQLALVAELLP